MLDGLPDTHVGTAATDVAGHLCVDICIGWMRMLGEKRRCGHDLSRLAVTTLGHLVGDPRFLYRGSSRRATHTLDGRDRLSGNGSDRCDARAGRSTVHVNGARTA